MGRCRWWAVLGVSLCVACAGGGNSDDDDDDDVIVVIDAAVPDDAPAPVPDAAATVDAPVPLPDAGSDGGVIVFPDADLSSPDGGVIGACNPVTQTGCAAGEKCAMILDDATTGVGHVGCAPDGTQAIDDVWTEATVVGMADDCSAGGDCYRGTCHEICTTVSDMCTDGTCVTFADSLGDPIPIEICLASCDLLLQDCPGPGEGCYLAGEPVCVGAGTADVGEPCAAANACLAGQVCVGSSMGGFFCRLFCGPWMDCFDAGGEVLSCACGATVACGPAEICFAIGDGMGGAADPVAGVCIPATDSGCDCTATPICPP